VLHGLLGIFLNLALMILQLWFVRTDSESN